MPPTSDSGQMDVILRQSPRQFAAGMAAAATVSLPDIQCDAIVVAGMGGSWMAAQLVADLGGTTVPMTIHRSYGLGHSAARRPLIIASSFSGNTEETLSAYDAAREAGHACIGIAAGGELEQRCQADGVPFIKIPADPPTMQPRCATGYSVGIFVKLLTRLSLLSPEAEAELVHLETFLDDSMAWAEQTGKTLSATIGDATPIVYASDAYGTVARIWKIKLNENAKTPAFWNVIPELNHNEMIGWTKPQGRFHVFFLRDDADHPRILKRFDITANLLQQQGIHGTMISLKGRTALEKTFSMLLVGDWLSYHLALARGVDPSPVPMVEDFKRRLKT